MDITKVKGKTIEQINLGDTASMSKTVSEYDVYAFAGITGDFNPAHINQEYAKNTPFQTRISHGMLSVGFISAVLGMKLPGPGSIYLEQTLQFKKPVKIGDTITALVKVIDILDKGKFQIVTFQTSCYNQLEELVIDGTAKIIPPK